MIPDAASKNITDYIVALAGLDRASKTTEKVKAEEEAQRRAVFEAKEALAAAVGYTKGDPPLSVKIPGEDKVIRFYTTEHDRCGHGGPGGSNRDYRQVIAVIERMA